MKLFHVVLWYRGSVVTSINVSTTTKREALESARLQYPNCTPEVTMSKELA